MSTISSRTGYFSEALPIRLASKALQLQWRVVTIPWSTFLFWSSCCCSLLLRFLIIAGAPPGEFYNKTKVSLGTPKVVCHFQLQARIPKQISVRLAVLIVSLPKFPAQDLAVTTGIIEWAWASV